MSEKKAPKAKSAPVETDEPETLINPLRLVVGVNFISEGDDEETRLEAGLIESGTLPPAFEQTLRERRILVEV